MFSEVPFKRATALLSAALLMAVSWGFFHFPPGNMLTAAFTFLTAALTADIRDISQKVRLILLLAGYAATAQLLVGITANAPLLRILLPALFAFFTLATFPNRSGSCIVLIVGYLACFAPGGLIPALDRCGEILFGTAVVFLITTLANGTGNAPVFSAPFPFYFSFVLSAELLLGHLAASLLQLKQGPWVMLTILFICQAAQNGSSSESLVYQRIFSVPLGILLGGWYLSCFCYLDNRFVYLVPFIGAAGFWMLYQTGNFFFFTVFFMMAFTILADWQTGPAEYFYFKDLLFSRSFATLLGVLLVLFGEVFSEKEYKQT